MRLIPATLGVLALALAPLAAAQPPVAAPGGVTPLQALGFGSLGATPQPVDATHPLPTTAANVANRDPGGTVTASVATALYSATTTRADTSPTSQSPGNFFATGGEAGKLEFDRVIEPGQSFAQFIVGKSYLVGAANTAMNCSISIGWTERAVGA